MAYRLHSFGFPIWTFAVLITGPIWAHQAWSSYWNWDPKEVWAFITWVVYAAYLHARSTAGWKGRNAAIVALVALATLWFNFIGINFFSLDQPALLREWSRAGRAARLTSGAAGVRVLGLAAPAPLPIKVAEEVGVVVRAERPLLGAPLQNARLRRWITRVVK